MIEFEFEAADAAVTGLLWPVRSALLLYSLKGPFLKLQKKIIYADQDKDSH